MSKNNTLAAGKCYEKAVRSNPKQLAEMSETFEKEFFEKCLEYKNKRDFKNSIVCLEGMSVLVPNSGNVPLLLADSYYQYDQIEGYSKSADYEILEKAETEVRKGLEAKPKDAAAHGLYGEILEKKRNFKGALLEYSQAANLDSSTSAYWVKLAFMQEKLDNATDAIESYHTALKINPNDTLVLYFLGNLYEKRGEKNKAIEMLDRLFEINPDYDDEVKKKLQMLKQLKQKKL